MLGKVNRDVRLVQNDQGKWQYSGNAGFGTLFLRGERVDVAEDAHDCVDPIDNDEPVQAWAPEAETQPQAASVEAMESLGTPVMETAQVEPGRPRRRRGRRRRSTNKNRE